MRLGIEIDKVCNYEVTTRSDNPTIFNEIWELTIGV